MAAGDLALNIIISATNMTGGAFGAVAGELGKLAGSSALGAVAAGALVAGVAVVGIGVNAAKAAGDFQQSMTMLVTSAGESRANIKMVSDGILQMSVDTATSTDQLSKGMYFIESSGKHGADGLLVLKAAAEGAKTENADLLTVSKALTTVMTDYHMPASQAAEAMNGLIATVQNGKTTLQELASSMGAVLPIASSLHIPFAQVAGAMDTMTNAGMSSQQAAQNLAHVLVALSAPSGVAVKSMTAVGLTAQQVKDALVNQGLPEALQLIEDAVGRKFPAGSVAYETALKNILGGLVGFKLAAMITGDSLKATQANIAAVTSAMKDNGGEVMGWSDIQQNFNFQLDRAKMAVQALMIAIGEKLLPILTPLIKAFADCVAGITSFITGVSTAAQAVIGVSQPVAALATNIGGVSSQLSGLFTWTKSAGGGLTDMGNKAVAAGTTLKGAGEQASQVEKAFSGLQMSLRTFGMMISQDFGQAVATGTHLLVSLGQSFQGAVVPSIQITTKVLDGLQELFDSIWMEIQGNLVPTLEELGKAVGKAYASFLSWLSSSNGIQGFFNNLIGTVSKVIDIIASLVHAITQTVGPAFDLFKKQLENIAAVLNPVWQAINSELLPAFGELVKAIGPLIASILKLLNITSASKESFTGIGQALAAVIWVIAKFVEGLADIIVGLTKVIEFITTLPDLVQQAMKAVITAFQTAWKAIVQGAQDAWKWIQQAWGSVGKWFEDLGKAIMKALSDAWAWIVKAASDTWNAIKAAAKTAWDAILNTITAPIHVIGDLFKWLYDHNYYFQGLVDGIRKDFSDVLTWAQSTWTKFVNWLISLWQSMAKWAKDTAQKAGSDIQKAYDDAIKWLQGAWNAVAQWAEQIWSKIADTVSHWAQAAAKFLQGIWDDVAKWLSDRWNDIVKASEDLWGKIGAVFANAWNDHILPALSAFWQSVSQWFSDRIHDAQKFGEDFMKGLADGIKGGANYFGQALHDAFSSALSTLGFHNIPGFASGVQNFTGGWAVVGERGPELLFLPSGASVIPSGSPPPVMSAAPLVGTNSMYSSQTQQPMIIYMMLDGRQIGKSVTVYQAGELRIQGGIRSA